MVLRKEGEIMYCANVHVCVYVVHTHIDMHTALASISKGLAAWMHGAVARG